MLLGWVVAVASRHQSPPHHNTHTCVCRHRHQQEHTHTSISTQTALGEAAADSLALHHPFASMGHLSHMPGHTYIRLGRWGDAVAANQAALHADDAIAKRWGGGGGGASCVWHCAMWL